MLLLPKKNRKRAGIATRNVKYLQKYTLKVAKPSPLEIMRKYN